MATVNVVTCISAGGPTFINEGLDEDSLKKIKAVSRTVKVTDASVLLAEEQGGNLGHKARFDTILADCEVLFAFRLPQNVLKRAPNLKWIQVTSAGVERYLNSEMIASPVILTNASGIHATPISEWVIMTMLMFAKRMPQYFEFKRAKQWERLASSVLNGRTVGVIGLGDIGREVARLAKAFRMNVIGTKRTVKSGDRVRYVDKLVPRGQIYRLFRESDFVVVAVPFTSETQKMVGEKELKLMKPSAYLFNIGRGDIIDEPVLIRALEEKGISGAGLDVFTREPLPADSKLWGLDNVILTPHVSGSMEDYVARACDLFVKNLKRYIEGKRLVNVVDKKRGY
ncbi:MAG: D-2-hydroxyacid dehydrogenase [Chloroflexota bacterium]